MNRREFERQEIDRIGDALELDQSTREVAEHFLQICDVMNIGNGRKTEAVVGSCLFVAVQEMEEPVSMDDIGRVTSVHTREIARSHIEITDEIGIHLEPSHPRKFVESYVERLNDEFNSQLPEETVGLAGQIIELSDDHGVSSGVTPMGVAAGAVYLAADLKNKMVTQQELAEVANITPGTVRNNANALRDSLEKLEGYEPK